MVWVRISFTASYPFFGIIDTDGLISLSFTGVYVDGLRSDQFATISNLTVGNGVAPVPVPPSVLLLGSGLLGLLGIRRFRS